LNFLLFFYFENMFHFVAGRFQKSNSWFWFFFEASKNFQKIWRTKSQPRSNKENCKNTFNTSNFTTIQSWDQILTKCPRT
jgi:hypothetical protein